MTLPVAVVVTMGTALLGAACAAADGALLGLDDEPPPSQGPEADAPLQRERTHHALSVARVTLELATGAAAAVALRLWERPPALAMLLALLLAATVSLLVEMGPRAVGDAYGADALRWLHQVGRASDAVFRPLISAALELDGVLRRLLPPILAEEAALPAGGERFGPVVKHAVRLPVDRRAVLRRVFSLRTTEVRDVMMPRVDITGLEKDTPWSEVVDRVRSAEHARLPVYDGTIDNVIGVLLAKDLLPAVVTGDQPSGGWLGFMRPAMFIPESKSIEAQLHDFRTAAAHIAIVVDEYGGTAGLVTIEDIIEEIVGDIRDEHDDEAPPIESEEGCRFWVSGRLSLDELSNALHHPFEQPGVTTVGGLIYDVLGRVPRSGEELTLDGFRVVVERVVRRRVERVYFERSEMLAERST
jgi:CBS domain containing-hemolysin-like protein